MAARGAAVWRRLLAVVACCLLLLAVAPLAAAAADPTAHKPAAAAVADTTPPQTTDSKGAGTNGATSDASSAVTSKPSGASAGASSESAATAQIPSQPPPFESTPTPSVATTPAPTADSTSTLDADIAAALKRQAEITRETKYVVGLLGKMPALPTPVTEGSRTVMMTAKSGRKFRCVIPHPSAASELLPSAPHVVATQSSMATTAIPVTATAVPTTPVTSSPVPTPAAASIPTPAAATPAAAVPAEAAVDPSVAAVAQRVLEVKTVPSLIRTHLGNGCFTKQINYWTYEVCPFKRVRQYHSQVDAKAVEVEFQLGAYTALGDVVKQDPTAKQNPPTLIYSQLFEGGTDNRQSLVSFHCNPDPNPLPNTMHMLISVQEPKAFHYEIEIRTTLLCRDAHGRIPGIGPKPVESIQLPKSTPAAEAASTVTSSPESVETGRQHTGPHRPPTGAANAPHVLDLLEPLGDSCLFLKAGWWTYKLCYLKEVTQFHREQVAVQMPQSAAKPGTAAVKLGAKSAEEAAANLLAAAAAAGVGVVQTRTVITAEFILGQLPASASLESLEAGTRVVSGDTWESTYVSQRYHSGTLCDLNNRPRLTETRIFCDLHEADSVIKSVVESATCEYIVVVHTPHVCSHPLFKPDMPKVQEIICEPIAPVDGP